jgi:hypothetical protein
MDFANWLLQLRLPDALTDFVIEFPNPSLKSIQGACDAVCQIPLLESLFAQHIFTSSRESEGRCFDICYISELLHVLLGERGNERIVYFLTQANGTELEWTLGYYLKRHFSPKPDSSTVPIPSTQMVNRSEVRSEL